MAKIEVDELIFECPICIEQFDESCKMLSCQHVFCEPCLVKIYNEADQKPNCPTCRQQVTCSLLELQRPILLLNLLEKVKTETQKSSSEVVADELETGVELSTNVYLKEQFETSDQEMLKLQIALSKSEEETLLQAKNRFLPDEKENLEYELALMKSEKSKVIFPSHGVKHECEQTHAVDFDYAKTEYVLELAEIEVVSVVNTDSEKENFDMTLPSVTEQLEEFNFNDESKQTEDSLLLIPKGSLSYLISLDQENIIRRIVSGVSNVRKFHTLNQQDLIRSIEKVDEFLVALTSYRKNSAMMLGNGSGDCTFNMHAVSQNMNYCNNLECENPEIVTNNCISDNEYWDLQVALEMSRQHSLCQNEDELLNWTLKRSETLDTIDKLKATLLEVKEKLEFRVAVLMSQELL